MYPEEGIPKEDIQTELGYSNQELYSEIEDRLLEIAKGYQDILGAAVMIGKVKQNSHDTPHLFKATVIVYVRPDNIIVDEKHEDLVIALQGALDTVEQQLQQRRDKASGKWDSSEKIAKSRILTPFSHHSNGSGSTGELRS